LAATEIPVGAAFAAIRKRGGAPLTLIAGKPAPTGGRPVFRFASLPSSGLETASWESKLELLHTCVPKLELGNKVEGTAWEQGRRGGPDRKRDSRNKERSNMEKKRKLCVALLAGGKSAERDVSLSSGDQVFSALDKARYDIRRYDPRDDLVRLAREASDIDVALVLLHGRLGEDGTIQGFLESLGIPYQGSGVLGSALAMNKIMSKALYQQAGLPVADYVIADEASGPDAAYTFARKSGYPVVVKPEHEGSSIGLSIARSEDALEGALTTAWRYDRRCLVERYIKGTEITGGVLGNDRLEALPLVEIIPGEAFEFFDHEAKYTPGATREICPARLSAEITQIAQDYARRAHQALCCRGYSRTDMIATESGAVYVLETNTIPGMTRTSLFPQAAAAAGLTFSALLDRLIELALEHWGRRP